MKNRKDIFQNHNRNFERNIAVAIIIMIVVIITIFIFDYVHIYYKFQACQSFCGENNIMVCLDYNKKQFQPKYIDALVVCKDKRMEHIQK